ncbi:GSCFA domain-containing protein [Hymenobacter metallilatus]|uniref:GSCFA domain-containing protein n=1 Tax=Hymenobacter metallilatus TaxID=2493666 RepID=A0A3R9U718_9BACT|nr:GSCFA domain-containing protein [Hymenobacter metallilatus]RSK24314.1 hypothetical protein EI290_20080 [Hymenobacter metallilatus]
MFRTELPLTPHPQQLPHSARVLTIGSCFSDSIGSRLREFKVATLVNPFGTVFNPISLCRLLRAAAGEDMDWQQHVVEARGRWQSYDLHAEIGAESPVELLQHIQTLTREVGVFLATADAVVLTLGSAFAYRLRETDEIISNCHKVPAEKFDKELLTADDIIAAVAETHAYLRRINPRLRFILTVSPVRHLKDTLVLNSASKSMLRVACHYLSELLPDVTYFPAYELLLDDLRDYRFYAADMLHPSEVAENYIWERFTRTYFDAAFGRFKKEWESIRLALGHRPLHAAAPEHRQFLESTLERLHRLDKQADVRMEVLHLEREIAALPLSPTPPEPEPEEEDDEERIDIGDDANASSAQATLTRHGQGVLLEADNDDDEEPAQDFGTPEAAYDHAYAAGLADEEDNKEEGSEVAGEETGEDPVRRKKRRSRGGAKRTKRKHARLAAEAAATVEPAESTVTVAAPAPESAPDLELEEPAATPAIVYIREEDLRQSAPVLAPEAQTPDDTTEFTPEEAPRRNRNNRRNKRERPPRTEPRSGRPPLYSPQTDAAGSAPTEPNGVPAAVSSQPEPQPTAVPEPVQPMPLPEPQPATEASASASRPKRTSASRSRAGKKATPTPVEVAATPLPVAEPIAAPVAAATPPEADAPVAAPKARPRRKPAKAALPAPDPAPPVEVAPLPAAPAAKGPTRKRAPRKPAATEAVTPVPEVPAATEEAVSAAPKRKPRPPRRKPATDAPAPENN